MLRFAILLLAVFAVVPTISSAQESKIVPTDRVQVQFSYAPLVKQVSPSVVNVYAARQVKQRRSPFAGDPFFEQFFGGRFGQRRQPRVSRSLGSGVIVAGDGIVITNHHVIENADQVKVALSDGREFEAEIKLIDKKSDLAVLKIEPDETLPAVPLGDAEALEVGDLVLAIGNPFGVGQTVTSGIVSALARSQNGVNDFGFFVQTDASINPGNSGGALVDMNGQLIGINTAIFTRSGGSNGIGFAVPSNMVRVVLDSVSKGSDVLLRPWIGAQFQAVTAEIAESLGMARPLGALVAAVTPQGPASVAGLNLGDIILEIDGKAVPHMDALGYLLTTAGLDRTIEMLVLSRNKQKTLRLALASAPENPPRNTRKLEGRSIFSGLTIANLSPRVAQELELTTDKEGVVITEVARRSLARRFGFQPKDILVEINGTAVSDTAEMQAISNLRVDGWSYVVERNGRLLKQYVR